MNNDTHDHLYKTHIITKILDMDQVEGIKLFLENIDILQDVNFIIPNPYMDGINYMEKFRALNLKGIDVNYFFTNEDLYGFNADSIMSIMVFNKDIIKTETLISLDTKIQSYLYRSYKNEKSSIPENIEEVLKLIKDRKWGVDCMAYMFENTLFNPEFSNNQLYLDNMYAFETYFFNSPRKAKSYTKKLLKFDNKLINDDFSNWYRRQYKLYYLELLVMADIQLNKSHLSLYDKEKEFVKFFHEKIGLLSDRETNLAKLYFMYGTKIGFFSKIQKGNKNIIKSLKNMAWDIFHIHNTINNLAIQTNKIIDITVPLFVTYDKRLKDILPIYKLKAAAFIKNSSQKWLNYVTNIIDPIIQNKYFVLQAYENRLNRMKENNVDEKSLLVLTNSYIESYEQKFL